MNKMRKLCYTENKSLFKINESLKKKFSFLSEKNMKKISKKIKDKNYLDLHLFELNENIGSPINLIIFIGFHEIKKMITE